MEESVPCVLRRLNDEMNKMSYTSPQFSGEDWKRRSIYKLPAFVTKFRSKAFNPQIVSIGPYHHGDENLMAMEEHKLRALFHFLKRSKKPLQCYVDALIPVVQDLKDAYDHLDLEWQQNTEQFLELMILDGCFILEILSSIIPSTQRIDDQNSNDCYARNDPIFSDHGKLYLVPFIKRDMLMLENQLPLLVLEKLLNVQMGSSYEVTMELSTNLIIEYLYFQYFEYDIERSLLLMRMRSSLHILDIYRKMLVLEHPDRHRKRARRTLYRGHEIIFSATELYDSGVKFRKSKSTSLRDISFRDGFLHLPVIVFDDTTELLYRNMIAFERFHVGAGNEVSSYIIFMDSVINSPTDVTLLERHGIIQNVIGSNKAVVNLIKSLSVELTLDPDNSLIEVHQEVYAYCMKPWNRWRANLIHDYFNDPKDSFNIQMAVFLFIFTVIQTIFTVLSYTSSSRTH